MIPQLLALFVFGHFLADWPLQTKFMATYKVPMSMKGWQWVLLGHSGTHGAMVGGALLLAGYDLNLAIWFAIIETALHALIDMTKATLNFSLHTDQALHGLCKLLYVGLIAIGATGDMQMAIYAFVTAGPVSALLIAGSYIWNGEGE